MCQNCGFYKGRLVIDMKAKSEARAARMQSKKDARAQATDEQSAPEGESETQEVIEEKEEAKAESK